MSRRALIYIVLGVIALHVAGFFVLRNVRPPPKYKAGPTPVKRNFKSYERVEVDAATGEKTIYRDIEGPCWPVATNSGSLLWISRMRPSTSSMWP